MTFNMATEAGWQLIKIEVVAAIIRKGDRIFATQRGYGEWKDWWEFPGGKMRKHQGLCLIGL